MSQELLLAVAKKKVRFGSNRGPLAFEHLFDLPLTSKDGFDLNSVAVAVHNDIEKEGKVSFVDTRSNPRKAELEVKLEAVKLVIALKQAEQAANKDKAAKDAKRHLLETAIANAQTKALGEMSEAELQAALAALDK